jgi:hypothetical protein
MSKISKSLQCKFHPNRMWTENVHGKLKLCRECAMIYWKPFHDKKKENDDKALKHLIKN